MKGRLDKTEQGWVVRYLKPEPKYIGEKYSIQEIPIYPDYIALCSYIFYEGKEVEFEILQGADSLYAHLFTKNNEEQQKELIKEIMDLDAKDRLYDTVNDTVTRCPKCNSEEVEAMTPRTIYSCGSSDYDQRPGTFLQSDKCKQNDTVNDVDADFPIEHKLASVWVFDTNASKWSNNDDTAGDNHASFIAGYNKAKQTLYTEEQMIGFAEWISGNYSFGNILGKWYLHENTDKNYTEKELFDLYIQSLKQPKQ